MSDTPADHLADELTALQRQLAESHGDDERHAELLYDRAELVEEIHGPTHALPLYEQSVSALAEFASLRRWLVSAANDVVVLRRQLGDVAGGSKMATWLVNGYLDRTPPEAVVPMANSVLVAALSEHEQGRTEAALKLIDRWLRLHGQPGADGHPRTTARALIERGSLQHESGDLVESVESFDQALRLLQASSDPSLDGLEADAVGRLAEVHCKLGHRDETTALCRYLVERWGNSSPDAPTGKHVPWAQTVLESSA